MSSKQSDRVFKLGSLIWQRLHLRIALIRLVAVYKKKRRKMGLRLHPYKASLLISQEISRLLSNLLILMRQWILKASSIPKRKLYRIAWSRLMNIFSQFGSEIK